MKKILLSFIAIISFCLASSPVFAVMSVQNAVTAAPAPTEKKMNMVEKACHKIFAAQQKAAAEDNVLIAAILGIVIGGLGIHRVLMGSKPIIILWYILLSFIGLGILLGFIDGILLLLGKSAQYKDNDKVFAVLG